MTAPAAITAPTVDWHGADAEPTDEFVDALVALLWNVVEKRAAAADGGADQQHQGGSER